MASFSSSDIFARAISTLLSHRMSSSTTVRKRLSNLSMGRLGQLQTSTPSRRRVLHWKKREVWFLLGLTTRFSPHRLHFSNRLIMYPLPVCLGWVTLGALLAMTRPASSNSSLETIGSCRPWAMTGGSPLCEFTPQTMNPG